MATPLQMAIRPKDQAYGWERRWANTLAELQRLLAPRDDPLSGAAVHAAQRELLGFYVAANHMRDALKREAPARGTSAAEIDAATKADADLALLVDLANVVKHGKLNRPPRSGDEPRIGQVQGSGKEGWRLEQVIEHKGQDLDGLDFAQAAVVAWERWLVTWGLLPAP